jgi:hypothetical protein
MPSDKTPRLARLGDSQLIVYAIRVPDEEFLKPKYGGRHEVVVTYYLATEVSDFWTKATHGVVTISGKVDDRIDRCAIVLADNSSRQAREIPNEEELAKIYEIIGFERKPRWYRLTSS